MSGCRRCSPSDALLRSSIRRPRRRRYQSGDAAAEYSLRAIIPIDGRFVVVVAIIGPYYTNVPTKNKRIRKYDVGTMQRLTISATSLAVSNADGDGFPPRAALSASAEVATPVAALEALFAASRGVGSSSQRASDDVVGMIVIIVVGGGGLTTRWRVSIALKLLLLIIVMLVSSLHL